MHPGRSLFFIALGLFGLYAVEFGVVGVLPPIIQRYDVSVALAGWLVGFFALVVAVCGPAMVLWLSRYDRRKILTGSLLGFAVCSLISAWAPSFGVLMALRVPSALLHPVFFSAAFAAAVSLYPPERATHATSMALVGTSMGLVIGVPLTTWIEATISYEASFYFCAIVNLAAAIGLWFMLPPQPHRESTSGAGALAVLRKRRVWLSIAATVAVFGAMFSVYSYAAEYLGRITEFSSQTISFLLVVFGVGGVGGNLLAGRLLGSRRALTVLLYPVALSVAYLLLMTLGSSSVVEMLPICVLWGAAHTSGLVVCQVWLTSAAEEAPEFATSLFVSSANLGTVCSSSFSGWFIGTWGLKGTLVSGWLFAALAVGFIVIRILLDRQRHGVARRVAT
ncbi:MFS transporter [Salinicola sp. V024]|uniref:MFS transporter n=1 Tax=unclassified Salinicola TaxID=2634022 RepID=UPI00094E31EB|nr:MFS transporter [Salinicola sp. MH3R3-1]OLO07811.1 arabinose ABC transporter permease [Salinicola sp. MH3R3-1]